MAEAPEDWPAVEARLKKRAPVQDRTGIVNSIPWEMHLRAYAAYSLKYGKQPALIDLEGRNCRGGFGTEELDGFIPGWRDELPELEGALSALSRALRRAEAAEQERDRLREAAKTLADRTYDYIGVNDGTYEAESGLECDDEMKACADAVIAALTEPAPRTEP